MFVDPKTGKEFESIVSSEGSKTERTSRRLHTLFESIVSSEGSKTLISL